MSEIIRGDTPDDIEKKCLEVCAKYLDGIWRDISLDKIVVKRISGGYTNLLFHCALTEDIHAISDEPEEVTIRFYGEKWIKDIDENERLSDVVINLLASEHSLGPKVYGIFSGGQIGQYIDAHHFGIENQKNSNLVKELARKLARFHSLSVPNARDYDWLKRSFYYFYDKAFEETPNQTEIIREINAKNLIENDFKEENEWILKCIDKMQSPIVYCHNDLGVSNILVNNRLDPQNDNNITLIDFEYSRHFYRGFDFGFYVNELGRNSDWIQRQAVPLATDDQIKLFLNEYRDEMIRIHGKAFADKDENSIEFMLREAKFFTLPAEMFALVFLHYTSQLPFSDDKTFILKKMDEYYGWYIERRKQLEIENIVPIPRFSN